MNKKKFIFATTSFVIFVAMFAIFQNADQPDLLDNLQAKFSNSSNPDVNGNLVLERLGTSSINEYLMAHIVASVEPKTALGTVSKTEVTSMLEVHPIGSSLVSLIDNTPRGARIRIAVYIFTNYHVLTSVINAIRRGVIVQVLTTESGNVPTSKRMGALDEINKAIAVYNASNPQETSPESDDMSWALLCSNKEKSTSPGGCISANLLHHKFVTFSSVCRFGLTVDNKCNDNPIYLSLPNSYKRVVFQGSWNFGNIAKHEMANIFFGYENIYKTYLSHFSAMKVAAKNKQPNLNFRFTKTLELEGILQSKLEINFLPRSHNTRTIVSFDNFVPKASTGMKDYRDNDVFLKDLQGITCKIDSKRTVIRIANTHWGSSSLSPVADHIITRIRELIKEGCIVKIMLPADMASKATIVNAGNGDDEINPTEILVSSADAAIYNALVNTGAEVRSFAYAPNARETFKSNAAHMHSKYALLEEVGSKVKKKIMFGTMSFTTPSHERNDEAWLVWSNPSSVAYNFYRNTFDKLWNSLIQQPSLAELDKTPGLDLRKLVGYWKLNGSEGTSIPDQGITTSVSGPQGIMRNPDLDSRYVRSPLQQGISFNGRSSYISIPFDTRLRPTQSLTISLWMKHRPGFTDIQPLVSMAQNGGYQLHIKNQSLIFIVSLENKYQSVSYPLTRLSNTSWTHVAASYNGSELKLYIDGIIVDTTLVKKSSRITYTKDNRLCIGTGSSNVNCSVNDFFNGSLDDVAIFNSALTPNEIKAIVNRSKVFPAPIN